MVGLAHCQVQEAAGESTPGSSHQEAQMPQPVFACVGVSAGSESFTSNNLELARVQRGPGLNDVGMVAWHMTLKTPECQQGRQVSWWNSSLYSSF